MKHIRKSKFSTLKSTVYLYFIGSVMKLTELLKNGCMAVLGHITELLILTAFVGMVLAYQAFEMNCINYITMMLFEVILGMFIVALIKIKILESRGEE